MKAPETPAGRREMPDNPRWKRRPAGSTWGDWGPDDQLVRLNLLTPDKGLKAVAEVKEGRPFCLSMPLDYPGGTVVNPRRNPPELRPTERNGMPNMGYPLVRDDRRLVDVICDDQVLLTLQYSTQWDSLAHVGQLFDANGDGVPEPVYYNGYRPGDHVKGLNNPKDAGAIENVPAKSTSYAHALGVENMAVKCMQGRGVMIDLHAHVGRAHALIGDGQVMARSHQRQ